MLNLTPSWQLLTFLTLGRWQQLADKVFIMFLLYLDKKNGEFTRNAIIYENKNLVYISIV